MASHKSCSAACKQLGCSHPFSPSLQGWSSAWIKCSPLHKRRAAALACSGQHCRTTGHVVSKHQMKRYFYALVRPGQCGSTECQGWHFAQRGSYVSGSTQTLRHFCTRVSTFLCYCPYQQWFYLLCLYFSVSSDHCPSKLM